MASNFRSWTMPKLNKRFKLERVLELSVLNEWLSFRSELSDLDNAFLQKMRDILLDNVFSWNEIELSLQFIGPILTWVRYTTRYTNLFDKRPITAIIDGEELSGSPDAIIAWGKEEPETPYFCLQEFKKENDPSGDPIGQCVSAMLVAQALNADKLPIYGIYIVGQNWYFVVLEGNKYAISSPLAATSDEIYDIYQKLLWLKEKIAERIPIELAERTKNEKI